MMTCDYHVICGSYSKPTQYDIMITLPLTTVIIPVIKHTMFYIYTTAGNNKQLVYQSNCIN